MRAGARVRSPRARGRSPRADEGQISVLLLGYGVIVLAVLFVAASATGVHLARHRLLSVADGAALAAANALDQRRFYAQGGVGPSPNQVVTLSDTSVRSAASAYLATADLGGLDDVRLGDPTGTSDGFTAQVTLVSTVPLPLLPALVGHLGTVTVTVTSLARADGQG